MQKSRFPNSPASFTAPLAILIALGITLSYAYASGPWVEVQPRGVWGDGVSVGPIHFIDAETGWANAPDYLLRTTDGGQSWRRHEVPHDFPRWLWEFSSPTTGWSLTPWRDQNQPGLLDDLEFFQTIDGGLTWQPKRGKVTELVLVGEEKPNPNRPLAENIRLNDVGIYFFDNQFGWIVGPTADWVWNHDWLGDPIGKLLAGNFLCSTRDAGESWTCQIHIYLTRKKGHFTVDTHFRMAEHVYFLNPQVGWIAPATGWMYHTTNGGADWEVVGHPLPHVMPVLPRHTFLSQLMFVDESRGWAGTTEGAWFTADGGRTWRQKFRGLPGILHADINGVWVPGNKRSPTGKYIDGIYYSADDGDTWHLVWEGPKRITSIVYHEVTQSLWAAGNGIMLQKNLQTAVTPAGKLATLWGKLKAGTDPSP